MKYYIEQIKPNLKENDIEFFEMTSNEAMITAAAHAHAAVELIYIADGKYMVESDGERMNVEKGDIVLFPSNSVHFIYHTEDSLGRYFVLKLTPDIILSIFKTENRSALSSFLKRQKGDSFVMRSLEKQTKASDILQEMIFEYKKSDELMLAAEKSLAFYLLISIYRDFLSFEAKPIYTDINEKTRLLIFESLEYINENYASELSAVECAKRINFSYSYYNKLFRSVVGKSFKEYLKGIRLSKAYNALILTDISVTEIALSYGYHSPAFFTSEFRGMYGLTPREVRKRGM